MTSMDNDMENPVPRGQMRKNSIRKSWYEQIEGTESDTSTVRGLIMQPFYTSNIQNLIVNTKNVCI